MSDGFLIVDKEPGMTSHDVVAMGRKALGTRKVGHAGTLDPMATGVLVLGFGNGTRLLQYITDGDKSYTATIVLGASTVTDDHEGEVLVATDAHAVNDA
jgi:tRNA pseudouridine55 synthase